MIPISAPGNFKLQPGREDLFRSTDLADVLNNLTNRVLVD